MRPELALKVKEEIDKLHKGKFIRVVVYPDWVSNIVPVAKKDKKVTSRHPILTAELVESFWWLLNQTP